MLLFSQGGGEQGEDDDEWGEPGDCLRSDPDATSRNRPHDQPPRCQVRTEGHRAHTAQLQRALLKVTLFTDSIKLTL